MKPSKYLERVKNMVAEASDSFELTDDFLLVERIPPAELKTSSGIIIAEAPRQHGSMSAEQPQWVYVLAAGYGWYNGETGEDVPLKAQPGDILLVGQASVKWFPTFEIDGYQPFEIGLTKDGETQFRFKKLEGYQKAIRALNTKVEGKVSE